CVRSSHDGYPDHPLRSGYVSYIPRASGVSVTLTPCIKGGHHGHTYNPVTLTPCVRGRRYVYPYHHNSPLASDVCVIHTPTIPSVRGVHHTRGDTSSPLKPFFHPIGLDAFWPLASVPAGRRQRGPSGRPFGSAPPGLDDPPPPR